MHAPTPKCRTCDEAATVRLDAFLYCADHATQTIASLIEYGTRGESRKIALIADGPGIVRIRERQASASAVTS